MWQVVLRETLLHDFPFDQVVDLFLRVSELRQNLSRMLTEPWIGCAQLQLCMFEFGIRRRAQIHGASRRMIWHSDMGIGV